jgi:Tfp pilus assembly protein PilF
LPDELPAATAVFSEAIREHLRPLEPTTAARVLLQTACTAFPHSASLANLHGLCLRAAGEHAAAYAELARALELRRVAELYRLEHAREDGTFFYGQFAEHIHRFPRGE